MKKILAAVLCIALLCGHALAFQGKNYPKNETAKTPVNGVSGSFAGENFQLEFDAAPECSNLADGLIQACFFAFDEAEEFYLELYLMLPETISAGSTIRDTDMAGSGASVTLYEVAQDNSETIWYTGQVLGIAYPEDTGFEIHISEMEKSDSHLSMRGTLNAELARFERDFPTRDKISLTGLDFSFTLPLNGAVLPDSGAAAGEGIPAIVPAFTLPPNYAVI